MKTKTLDIDKKLVQECLNNDPRAQRELFETHARYMLAVCYRYVNDYDTAHDLMQDGFIKVFKNLESYRNECPLKNWISKVMVNNCLMHLRKEKKMLKAELEEADQLADDNTHFVDHLEMDIIMNSISKLPETLKMVLNMFAIDGYSYEEIAKQLELEEASVRSYVFRARKQLAIMLKQKTGIGV